MRPRPENPNKRRIRAAAFALMQEKGYSASSYTEIALKSGCGRPLVQRHFPKKELFILELVSQAASRCRELLSEAGVRDSFPVTRALHLTQLYLSLLLYDRSMIALTRDVLSQRCIMSDIIMLHYQSAFSFSTGAPDAACHQSAVKAMGGTYELMVDLVDNDAPLDADDLAAQTLAAYVCFTTNAAYGDAYQSMRRALLPRELMAKLVPRVIATLRGDLSSGKA